MTTNPVHKEIPMELDELKSAWQALDRKLERENSLRLDDLRDRKLGKVHDSLRPLFRGQVAQILFGIPFIALAALLWMTGPESASVIAAGIVLQAYGIITVIAAGVVLGQIAKIDYTAPVLQIQKQLARLRTLYVRSGMLAGLPWWFLWVVVLIVLAGLDGTDLLTREPEWVAIGLGVGAAGLLATWWFHRWARRAERADFGRRMDDSLTGSSLRKARAQLDALARFEQE
jgi:hypothetical protein